jgi:hypothetical protein
MRRVAFRPQLNDCELERREVLSRAGVVEVGGMVQASGLKAFDRAFSSIQSAYNLYFRELTNASRGGQAAIRTGARTPAIALLGFQNFAAIKTDFLNRQLAAAVARLPYGMARYNPGLTAISASYMAEIRAATSMDQGSALVSQSIIRDLVAQSRAVLVGPRPVV